jgi:hypothetical protein
MRPISSENFTDTESKSQGDRGIHDIDDSIKFAAGSETLPAALPWQLGTNP